MPSPVSPRPTSPPSSPPSSPPPRTPSPRGRSPESSPLREEPPVKKPRLEVVHYEDHSEHEQSPASSPPPQSPRSSPPPQSPESSPPRHQEDTPVKHPRWHVFAFREGINETQQASRSTQLRWEERGFVHGLSDKSSLEQNCELNVDEVGREQQAVAPEVVSEQVEVHQDPEVEEEFHDSDSDFPPSDSSDSDGPPSEMSDAGNDTMDSEEEWYDSEEERLHQDEFQEGGEENGGDIPLYPTCKFTREEAMLDLLDDFISNKETQKSLKDHLGTFLKYLPPGHTMPKSVYLLFKYLRDLAPTYVETPFFYCKKCLLYASDKSKPCKSCEENKFGEFYMIDLETQIRFYFEHRNLASVMDKYSATTKERSSDNNISDICDGKEYIRVKINDRYSITLMWNTDGVSLSNSSKCGLYPILAIICEVPPRLRSKYLIVVGVWCDPAPPPMNTLLRPFCENLVKIESCSGVLWTHPQSGEEFRSVVSAPFACADAPVRAQIQNIKSHNSKYACNVCEQKSDKIPLTANQLRERAAGNKKIKIKRRFLFQKPGARLRSAKRMAKQAKKAFLQGKSVKGVLGASVVQNIPRLDVSTCVLAEYMHSVCLGITKLFLDLWLNVSGPWFIGNRIVEIDAMLSSVKPPDFINRIPSKASNLSDWKASEFRAWLLFFSLIIAGQFLPDNYAQHWMCFVMAIFILLQENISKEDFIVAQTLLDSFVQDIGRLYNSTVYVYNQHQLTHLCLYVSRWGPLWATSAFMFEDFNGTLSKIIHGTKNRAKELMNLLRVSHGVEILRERVRSRSNLGQSTKEMFELLSASKNYVLSAEDQEFILSSGFNLPFEIYSRISLHKEIFTSLLYHQEQKRVNYCVGFEHDGITHYGEIKFFVSKGALADTYAFVKVFKVDQFRFFVHTASGRIVKHIIPVQASDVVLLVHVKSLYKVLQVDSYVCLSPNMYERKL